jgi:hypothetical protein
MSPVEALCYLLEENGLTQAELCSQTSLPVATISEVLLPRDAVGDANAGSPEPNRLRLGLNS